MRVSKEEALKKLQTFTNEIQSIILATVDEEANPFSSYTPFVEDEDGNYYVCVSSLVSHSHNMTVTKKAHIMFIEDESKAESVFFRKRLYFDAQVEKFEQDDKRAEKISKLFINRFGETSALILSMNDFRIYKLIPKEGSFVLGFGAAFSVSADKKTLKQKGANTSSKKAHSNLHEDNL